MPKQAEKSHKCSCLAKCGGIERNLSRYMYYQHRKIQNTSAQLDIMKRLVPGENYQQRDPLTPLANAVSAAASTHPGLTDAPVPGGGTPVQAYPATPVHDGATVVHADPAPRIVSPTTVPRDEDGHPELPDDPFPPDLIETVRSTALYDDQLAEATTSRIPDIQLSLDFRNALENASLDNGDLGNEQLTRLRDPQPMGPLSELDRDVLMSLRVFLSTTTSSDIVYENVRQDIVADDPTREILSHKSVKKLISDITGILPIVNDMCPKSCIAYTGATKDLQECPYCHTSRLDPQTQKARQHFYTMPLGPQLQALWANPTKAHLMEHRRRETERILKEIKAPGSMGKIPEYQDVYHGSEYLKAVDRGDIKPNNMTLMFSMDGAQLYQDKKSDCWIYIWVLLDLPPDIRYKQRNVIVGGVIPGPENPKHMESFLFPGFHHLAALQKEGLKVYNSLRKETFTSDPFLLFGSADGPGSVHFTGFVGHQGHMFCRLYCGVQGRHKPGKPQYYGALLKPTTYQHVSGSHPDVVPTAVNNPNPGVYTENLIRIINAPNRTQYNAIRKDTGLSSTSIFSGLPSNRRLPVPTGFAGDCMHVANLNLGDLLIPLWRGTFQCDTQDNVSTWNWAVLRGDTWTQHGADVARCRQYMPGSYDRPPRNLAEKVSSGYKAKEWQNYFYGVAPALLYGILPQEHWENFCKLVYAMRLLHQKNVPREHVREAHKNLAEFCRDFELLYVQRRIERLHFVRPCLHALLHMAAETIRLGPISLYSTWTMERAIGYLGAQIRQPSNPYHNLSERGLRQCQVNSLLVQYPQLERKKAEQPQYSEDLGDGYVFLRACERYPSLRMGEEGRLLKQFFVDSQAVLGRTVPHTWKGPLVRRWARLQLPNGQVARCAWKECSKSAENVRRARMVKVILNKITEYGEILYYFYGFIDGVKTPLALIDVFSRPDDDLFKRSCWTVWSVKPLPYPTGLRVIAAKAIQAVVAAIPHTVNAGTLQEESRLFIWEQFGLEIALWSEALNNPTDEADTISLETDK